MFEKIISNKSNSFYKIDKNEIYEAENRMHIKMPYELKCFYESVGVGFIGSQDGAINRLLSPNICTDIRLREDIYEYDPDLKMYVEFEEMAMIFLRLTKEFMHLSN